MTFQSGYGFEDIPNSKDGPVTRTLAITMNFLFVSIKIRIERSFARQIIKEIGQKTQNTLNGQQKRLT